MRGPPSSPRSRRKQGSPKRQVALGPEINVPDTRGVWFPRKARSCSGSGSPRCASHTLPPPRPAAARPPGKLGVPSRAGSGGVPGRTTSHPQHGDTRWDSRHPRHCPRGERTTALPHHGAGTPRRAAATPGGTVRVCARTRTDGDTPHPANTGCTSTQPHPHRYTDCTPTCTRNGQGQHTNACITLCTLSHAAHQ